MNDRLFRISVFFGLNGEGRGASVDVSNLPASDDPVWNQTSSGAQRGLAEGYRHEVTMQAAINGEIVEWTVPAKAFFDLIDSLRDTPRRCARKALKPAFQFPNCDPEEQEYAIRDMLRDNDLPED